MLNKHVCKTFLAWDNLAAAYAHQDLNFQPDPMPCSVTFTTSPPPLQKYHQHDMQLLHRVAYIKGSCGLTVGACANIDFAVRVLEKGP